jgi:hypothetical protein
MTNGEDAQPPGKAKPGNAKPGNAKPGNAKPGKANKRVATIVGVVSGVVAVTVLVAVAWGSGGAGGPIAASSVSPGTSLSPFPTSAPLSAVEQTVKAQGQALLRGDEQGWLAAVDQTRPESVTRFRSLFRLLQQLRVSSWGTRVSNWRAVDEVTVDVDYCFGARPCPKSTLLIPLRTRMGFDVKFVYRDGRIGLTDFQPSRYREGDERPTPWEDLSLTVAEGKRVVVAAAPGAAKWLDEAVAAGDQAATVDDRFTLSSAPPERYIVFLATSAEWDRWFGGQKGKYTLGYAQSIGGQYSQYEVVLNMDRVTKSRMSLREVMQHEMGHVATLTGNTLDQTLLNLDWSVEGIAEYIAYRGQPLSAYPRLATVRKWIRTHGWRGTVSLAIYDENDLTKINAHYGESFLVVRCLADRYGEAKLLRFFKIMSADHKTSSDASLAVFGKDWGTVDRGCVSFVRGA